jgi:glycine/D-amino acid oxidase-like deaminating enzyme
MDPQRALAQADPRPFWLYDDEPAPVGPAAGGRVETDLLVVGGGFTGLWTAIVAKEADADRDVVLVDAGHVAIGASGRNGGFLSASLTHGLGNALARWPAEAQQLERLGMENFEGIRRTLERYGIDAGFETPGYLRVATEPYQLPWLDEEAEAGRRYGADVTVLSAEQVRDEVRSPTYLGAVWQRSGRALVHPGRLARGLREACVGLGVRVHENTPVESLAAERGGLRAAVPGGAIAARRAVLATSAFPPLIRSIRRTVVPVYDYALVTEPLSAADRAAVGWSNRQGIADLGNRFHYYRLTPDDRILFGGYDAVYHYASRVSTAYEQRPATFATLARHFARTFPQLDGIRFAHAWGGAIDSSTRFCATFGRALDDRVSYAVGFTGLGVGASRFGARVALDLADGRDGEHMRLELVRSHAVRFPPEPLRSVGIALTKRALARSDEHEGRRGPWLRALDRLGLGFES